MIPKALLGSIAVIFGLVSYLPYFKGLLSDRIKPHAFSWLIWGSINCIAFAAQLVEGSGPGSWVTAITALMCLSISVVAFARGDRKFALFDWLSLGGAAVSLLLWQVTSEPASAIVMVALTDIFGFLPTLRKGFHKPHEEGASHFALSGAGFLIALFAIETYTLATWLYPAVLFILDSSFAVLLLVRRAQTRKKS